MARRISEGRKTAYYTGTAITIAGLLLFLSVFVTAAMNFGDFSNFEADAQSAMLRAIGGIVLLVLGGFVRRLGARGLAGAGVVLDPSRAREELEPYSRMAGGMAKDALDEADVDLGGGGRGQVVMVRCRACHQLNEEGSKFCQECGKPV